MGLFALRAVRGGSAVGEGGAGIPRSVKPHVSEDAQWDMVCSTGETPDSR